MTLQTYPSKIESIFQKLLCHTFFSMQGFVNSLLQQISKQSNEKCLTHFAEYFWSNIRTFRPTCISLSLVSLHYQRPTLTHILLAYFLLLSIICLHTIQQKFNILFHVCQALYLCHYNEIALEQRIWTYFLPFIN